MRTVGGATAGVAAAARNRRTVCDVELTVVVEVSSASSVTVREDRRRAVPRSWVVAGVELERVVLFVTMPGPHATSWWATT